MDRLLMADERLGPRGIVQVERSGGWGGTREGAISPTPPGQG